MAEIFDSLAERGPVLGITFVQNLIAFCTRSEVTKSDVISGRFLAATSTWLSTTMRNMHRDPRLNVLEKFHMKPPEAEF